MKSIILIIFLGCFICDPAFSQDEAKVLNKHWEILKTQLIRRTHLITVLTNELKNSEQVNKKELAKTKTLAAEISKNIASFNEPDSVSLFPIRELNDTLSESLLIIITSFENDLKFKKNSQVMPLLAQLEGAENRITLARNEYNDACREFNRTDLLFIPVKATKAVEIDFN